jgi:tetratricopeptide (TPR) repeat protein
MKKFTCLQLGVFIIISAFTQDNEVDSLKRILVSAKEDTSHVWVMLALARDYEYSKPDSAIHYAQQAVQLAKKFHFAKGEAKGLDEISYLLSQTGNYPKALETSFKSLKIYESLSDQQGIAVSYNTIGIIYNEQGEGREALNYFFRSKAIMEKLGRTISVIIRIENIAEVYGKMNLLDSALFYINKAYQMRFDVNDMNQINITLLNLGNTHSKLGHTDTALFFYRRSIPYSIEDEDVDGLSETYIGMAKLFKIMGKKDSAFYYAHRSFESALTVSGYKKMMLASEFLASAYEEEHNTDSAFRYLKILMATKDTLFSEEKINEVKNLSFNEQSRQLEIAEEKARSEEERRHNLQMMAIAVFIISFFIVVLILSRVKTRPRLLEFLGLVALLLLFEFIALFLHPYIANWTAHTPVYMLLILVFIASILVPLHHRLEHWVKQKLVKKHQVSH